MHILQQLYSKERVEVIYPFFNEECTTATAFVLNERHADKLLRPRYVLELVYKSRQMWQIE